MIHLSLAWFDPARIARSGQCFRFSPLEGGGWGLTALGRRLCVYPDGEGYRFDCTPEEWETVWRGYFDLDTDYEVFAAAINPRDSYLTAAAACAKGVRILRQDPWETTVAFILSQQSNIPRITRNLEAVCRAYGAPFADQAGKTWYDIPTPSALAGASEGDLRALGLGYRAPYLRATAARVAAGEPDLTGLGALPYKTAHAVLVTLPGVGNKVADCICLFGFHKLDAFPIDTHIRQMLEAHYKRGFPMRRYKGFAGVLQQYAFYYELYGGNG